MMPLSPKIVYTVKDASGDRATTEVKVPTGLSLGNMLEFGQDMAELVDNMIQGVITGASLCVDVDLSAVASLKSIVIGGADVEHKGLFNFLTSLGTTTRLAIPTLDESKVSAGTDSVDTSDTDVAAFITAMEDGITLTDASTVQPTDAREEDITSLDYAREYFRASGRRK